MMNFEPAAAAINSSLHLAPEPFHLLPSTYTPWNSCQSADIHACAFAHVCTHGYFLLPGRECPTKFLFSPFSISCLRFCFQWNGLSVCFLHKWQLPAHMGLPLVLPGRKRGLFSELLFYRGVSAGVRHSFTDRKASLEGPALLPHTLPPSEGSSLFTQMRRCLGTCEGTREKGDKGGLEEKMNIYAARWVWQKLKPNLPLGRNSQLMGQSL